MRGRRRRREGGRKGGETGGEEEILEGKNRWRFTKTATPYPRFIDG